MNFYNIIQNILNTSSRHKNVKEVSEGDIYNYLNSGEHKYPCVFLTVGEVTDSEMSRNVNCTLFYVDRLVSDQSNRTSIQSLGITTLGDILDTIEGDVVSVNYTTFTEKFTDMCAGVFATADITYSLNEMCDEDFEVRQLEVTENGIYDTIGYDEFVVNVVEEELVERVEELEEIVSKKEEQINSVTSLSITKNGIYTPPTDVLGYNNIEVNVNTLKIVDGVKLGSSTSIPEYIDTSEVTDFSRLFYNSTDLITIPQIDTSNGNSFNSMFSGCSKLSNIPVLDTSKGTIFNYMFSGCKDLITIPQIDTNNGSSFVGMFSSCSEIENITLKGSIGSNIDFSPCTKLTYNSIKNILNACSNTTNLNNKTLKFNISITDSNGELMSLVAICNTKGWTISGLTLN